MSWVNGMWVGRKRELSGLVSTLQLCRKATEGKDSTLPTEKDYFNFAESKREAEETHITSRELVACACKSVCGRVRMSNQLTL